MKGVIFHGKLELGIPRLKGNDFEFPGILRNSKSKKIRLRNLKHSKKFQRISYNHWEFFVKSENYWEFHRITGNFFV